MKQSQQHRVTFLPGKQTGYFEDGLTVRDVALELGILIESDCAGLGTCAKCKIELKEGINSPTTLEQELLTPQELKKGIRLACQAPITDATTCILKNVSKPGDEQIMIEGQLGDYILNPDIKKVFIEIPKPELGEKYFDFDVLLKSLKQQGYPVSSYNQNLLKNITRVIRAENFKVTAVLDQEYLLTLETGDTTKILYGLAIDLGTTTVAAKLVNLVTGEVVAVNSAANPQIAHGADLVSRLQYIIRHPGGLKRLNQLIIKLINALVKNLANEAGVKINDIYKLCIAGNTAMQHIALNIDPRSLATKPFAPAFQGPETLDASGLGIEINPHGVVYSIPNLACYVGSDITAVLTVLDLDEQDDFQLAIDIGTNGEMVLGSKNRLLCCSSPAGPAWEGACITWGMRATRGAIERAEIKDRELKILTIGGSEPIGICGSGLIDIISEFLRAGAINKNGRILKLGQLPGDKIEWLQKYIIEKDKGGNDLKITATENNTVIVSQDDVREIQLAKGAIASGIAMLLKVLEISPDEITNVFIAGAFGNHIRAQDVLDLGMIPQIPAERIEFVGNAALTGAEAILKSTKARQRAEQISRKIEYVEIAGRPDFQEKFVDALHFSIPY